MGNAVKVRYRALWWSLAVVGGLAMAWSVYIQFFAYVRTDDYGSSPGLSNIKHLNVALLMYQVDYDDRFPPKMTTNEELRTSLGGGYCQDERIFLTYNADESEFLGNGLLTGRRVTGLHGQETTVTLYDSKIRKDKGLRNVAFVDGHAKFVDEGEFVFGLKVEYLTSVPE